jgi:mannitol-1-phosphate 5-dehydrogenase
MAHGLLAYRGWLQGHEYIADCANDQVVTEHVKAAMQESAAALVADGRMTQAEADEHLSEFPLRGSNPSYRDTIHRVAADPKRKLGRMDRFIGPLLLAREHNLPRTSLARAAACALLYASPEDKQAVWIQERIREMGLRLAIRQVCGLAAEEDDVVDGIAAEYRNLEA